METTLFEPSTGCVAGPPIFIVGSMHSGTTMLVRALERARSVYGAKHETKFFDQLPMLRGHFGSLDEADNRRRLVQHVVDIIEHGGKLDPAVSRATLDGQAEARAHDPANPAYQSRISALADQSETASDYGAVFCRIFDVLAREAGKGRWIEKTPSHIFRIDDILKVQPDARIVEVVRDPRDVLASKKTRRLTVDTGRYSKHTVRRKRFEKAYDALWDTLTWKSAVRAGLRAHQRYPDRVMTVRYEDLVTEPQLWLSKICDFCELEYRHEMLTLGPRNRADGQVRSGAIAADSVKRWPGVLSAGEVDVCQRVARDEMREHGYHLEPPSAEAMADAPIVLARSAWELPRRVWKRYRLGGHRFLLNTLVGYGLRLKSLASTVNAS